MYSVFTCTPTCIIAWRPPYCHTGDFFSVGSETIASQQAQAVALIKVSFKFANANWVNVKWFAFKMKLFLTLNNFAMLRFM